MNPATSPSTNQLPRVLGLWMATAIVIGTVIGSGVFKKPQAVSSSVTEFGLVMLAWVLGGLLALLGALSLAEVAVRLPRAGGNYVFLREAYGRWAGFLWGWVEFWIIRSGSIAALASIFTDSLHDMFRQYRGVERNYDVLSFWERQGITVITITILAFVNARGTRLGGALQLFITTVKVLSLIGIAILPFAVVALDRTPSAAPRTDYLLPFFPSSFGEIDWSKFGAALVGVLWAYHGWMNIAPIAEEVKNPNRNIPRALLFGVGTIILLYLSANVAYYLIIPQPEMATIQEGRTAVGEFGFRLLGPLGLLLASAAVMTSVFGSLNGNLLVGPRLLYAMGKDGLAPHWLARIHANYQTPAIATAVLAGWSILLIIGAGALTQFRLPTFMLGSWEVDLNVPKGKPLFDVITDFAMFGAISFETLAVASIFVFRFRYRGASDLPYRCPFYPWIPILYVMIMAAVLTNMFVKQKTESLIGVGFITFGAILYLAVFWRRPSGVGR